MPEEHEQYERHDQHTCVSFSLNLLQSKNLSPRVQLEDHHASIVANCDQIGAPMCCDDPETIVLAAKGVDPRPLGDVPDSDGAVFRVGQNQLLGEK